MGQMPGVEVKPVEACTAHDGTWAMKKEFFELSMKWGRKAFDGMRDADAHVMATDCPLAAVQIEEASRGHPKQPVAMLARGCSTDWVPRAGPTPSQEDGLVT